MAKSVPHTQLKDVDVEPRRKKRTLPREYLMKTMANPLAVKMMVVPRKRPENQKEKS